MILSRAARRLFPQDTRALLPRAVRAVLPRAAHALLPRAVRAILPRAAHAIPRSLSRLLRAVPLLLLAPALGSCGPGRNTFAPACPVPGLVKPLTELTRYRGGSRDLSALIIRARVTDVLGKCEPGGEGTLRATVQVVIDVTRGPAFEGQSYELPLFVAVTDADAIRDKTVYALSVSFGRNVDNARAVSPKINMELPVSAQKTGAAYGIIAGFQLTPDEIAAARRDTRRP